MNPTRHALPLSALILGLAATSTAQAADPLGSALIGAGVGAAIGHGIDGRNGALVGTALGAIAGTAISTSSYTPRYQGGYNAQVGYYPPRGYAQPVYSQPVYAQPVYAQPVYAQPVVYAPPAVYGPAVVQPVVYGNPYLSAPGGYWQPGYRHGHHRWHGGEGRHRGHHDD